MNFEQLLATVTPEIYQRMQTAIELGKWPNGAKLTEEQKQQALQITIAYQAKYESDNHKQAYQIRQDGSMIRPEKDLCATEQTNQSFTEAETINIKLDQANN